MQKPDRIMKMACAYYDSCVLMTAVELNIFGVLAGRGSGTLEELAHDCRLDLRGGRLLFDACVALGLLEKDGAIYRNSSEAALFLAPDSPASLARAILYNRDVYPAWGRLAELATTGRPVEPPSEHLGDDPERTRRFVMAMHGRALAIGRAVIPALELGDSRRVLDVGGGSGAYAMLMAQARPGLSVTVLDLPAVAAVGRQLLAGQPGGERVSFLPGSYHETEFPGGMDAVTFLGVLHQESPESIVALLRKAHAALTPGGRVFVMDMMTDASRAAPAFSALFAVNMALTAHHGWVFSDTELQGWLEEAGFRDARTQPLPPPMPHWITQAVKA